MPNDDSAPTEPPLHQIDGAHAAVQEQIHRWISDVYPHSVQLFPDRTRRWLDTTVQLSALFFDGPDPRVGMGLLAQLAGELLLLHAEICTPGGEQP